MDSSVDDHPVSNITVAFAADVSFVPVGWLKPHPSLRSAPVKPVPRAAVSLRAANGLPLNVLDLLVFP